MRAGEGDHALGRGGLHVDVFVGRSDGRFGVVRGSPRSLRHPEPRWVGLEREPWVVRAFDSRRVRVVAVTVAVVLIGLSVWYRVAVVPELTALEYDLWVVGTDNDLVIEVDIESDLVLVANVPSGLPDMVVDDQAVYVRAASTGAGVEAVELGGGAARCVGRAVRRVGG